MNKIDKYIWSENYLTNQGYSINDIDKYFNIELNIINEIKKELFSKIVKNKTKDKKLTLVFGQPGCGKTTYLNSEEFIHYVILDIDTYREFHPFKNEIIDLINNNHQKNTIPEQNSPGRDFTNFTRKFIGILFDELFDECIKKGYNIALQKNISDYKSIEPILEKLRRHSYETTLVLPLVESKKSWERCQIRNKINNMKLNTVSKDFHDNYVNKLPQLVVELIENHILINKYIEKIELIYNNKKTIIDRNCVFEPEIIKDYISKKLDI